MEVACNGNLIHTKISSVRWLVARSDRNSVGYGRVPASSAVNITVLGHFARERNMFDWCTAGTCSV